MGGLFAQDVQLGVLGPALLFEFGVAVAEPFGPGVGQLVAAGDRSGFAFIEEVVLASGDLGQGLLDRGDPLRDVVALVRCLPA
ncbi:hypothetical protein [Nocardia asteroides]|uniref:hypothetical protein n=1 Tax=Nocardia asteroides TaxID=1824 RepID=UPI001E457A1C|nr:hypothetical protein [Nocardia asteroides]UGT59898.1 hypothetical protein LTT61_22095 [Nocardia asteroides]